MRETDKQLSARRAPHSNIRLLRFLPQINWNITADPSIIGKLLSLCAIVHPVQPDLKSVMESLLYCLQPNFPFYHSWVRHGSGGIFRDFWSCVFFHRFYPCIRGSDHPCWPASSAVSSINPGRCPRWFIQRFGELHPFLDDGF